MTAEFEDVTIGESHDGTVARIALSRPQKMNALSANLLSELRDALSAVEGHPDAKVLVLTGEGDAFSAGYDLSPGGDDRTIYEDFRHEQGNYALMRRIREFPMPTVAAVNGYALAGGFELSQMADIVIASEEAEFGYPITRGTGTPPVFFLPFVVDQRTARELLFTGRHVPGEEAAEIGLANRAVPPDELEGAVDEMVEMILKSPSDLLYLNKRMMNRALDVMGYASVVEQGHDLHLTGHGAPSVHEFGRRVEEDGLAAALAWRDETIKE